MLFKEIVCALGSMVLLTFASILYADNGSAIKPKHVGDVRGGVGDKSPVIEQVRVSDNEWQTSGSIGKLPVVIKCFASASLKRGFKPLHQLSLTEVRNRIGEEEVFYVCYYSNEAMIRWERYKGRELQLGNSMTTDSEGRRKNSVVEKPVMPITLFGK